MKYHALPVSRLGLCLLAVYLLWISQVLAANKQYDVVVDAGKHDRVNEPVKVSLVLPEELKDVLLAEQVETDKKIRILGQLTKPGLLDALTKIRPGYVRRDLHFILPNLKAGSSSTITFNISSKFKSDATNFKWTDTPGQFTELSFGNRPILRYMYQKLDDSNKKNRELTYKVYHHLYDPTGKQIVTKGPGGRYTHHRGIFYGFNRVSYGNGKKADVWHCSGDAHQSHEDFLSSETGPVLGRHRIAIDWHGQGKVVFAKEEREMTVYHVPGGQLVEFASKLSSASEKLKLDGDPQHAGFQFRASNEVAAKTNKQTYYLRLDGKGKLGGTRNWPGNKTQVNLPWNAMSFVLGDQRYTVAYLDKPTNPKEARYSERDYGRFGSYFVYEFKGKETLDLNYRVWLQQGETTVENISALSNSFVEPVKTSVRSRFGPERPRKSKG